MEPTKLKVSNKFSETGIPISAINFPGVLGLKVDGYVLVYVDPLEDEARWEKEESWQ